MRGAANADLAARVQHEQSVSRAQRDIAAARDRRGRSILFDSPRRCCYDFEIVALDPADHSGKILRGAASFAQQQHRHHRE